MTTNVLSAGTLGGIGTPLNFNVFWIPVLAGSVIPAGSTVYLDKSTGVWTLATTSFITNTIYGICNDEVNDSADNASPIISVTCWGLANIITDAVLAFGALLTISDTNAGQMMAVTDEIGEGLAKTFSDGTEDGPATLFFNGFGDTDTDTGGT
jgi:DeoR/GlpR family transcriptional regulator of sugar metabolism